MESKPKKGRKKMIDHIHLYLAKIGRKGGKVSSEAKSTAAIEREARKREAREFDQRLKTTRAKK